MALNYGVVGGGGASEGGQLDVYVIASNYHYIQCEENRPTNVQLQNK